ncbi:11S globulin seed storage protein 2 [Amborella trichopoda]|uniref:11S globulin seed storage protein 2 n=1 Tax=Amborella trichopoda TaxID=13333 RepID=UPI0009BFA6AE|nr:11S globulin seed storage protein 2 [Amborella trichopoda]|eukprot:XP_020531100.1 11S globulin seed storage protein 2 [Amborella trichopoda]
MAHTKSILTFVLLSLLVCAFADRRQSQRRLSDAQQCRMNRISGIRPTRVIRSEGGITELWDEDRDEFQCAGVAATRNTLNPNSLYLPSFSSAPQIVYIERGPFVSHSSLYIYIYIFSLETCPKKSKQANIASLFLTGRGIIGLSAPGCSESFHSGESGSIQHRKIRGQGFRDQHQKVQRIERGDVIAIPPGITHWCYNDDNSEELVAFTVTDVTSDYNQLDTKQRQFFIAGGQPRGQRKQGEGERGQKGRQEGEYGEEEQRGEQGKEKLIQTILPQIDTRFLAEALDIPIELAQKIQREDERGIIIKVEKEGLRILSPEGEEREEERERETGPRANVIGVGERYCNAKIRQNIESLREADIYSRHGGHLKTINRRNLPILDILDMSAAKVTLYSDAILAPHWSINAHTIAYITRGEGQIQIIGTNGQKVMDDRVRQGDVIIVPQFFTSMCKAGSQGIEWIAIKTSDLPMNSPLVGYTSAIKGMPIEVLTNAYRISNQQAQDIKYNREDQIMIFPSSSRSASS